MPLAFRKARRNLLLALRAPRSAFHFAKMTVQEYTEKQIRMPTTPISRASMRSIISQKLIWRRKAKGAANVIRLLFPNLSIRRAAARKRLREKTSGEARYNRVRVLLELVVENYAVIERVRVRFHAGLNLLTGETGSGKSIVVDALGLLLGGRASAGLISGGGGPG